MRWPERSLPSSPLWRHGSSLLRAGSAIPPDAVTVVAVYGHDAQASSSPRDDTNIERGPPASYDRGTAHVADDHWSRGDLVRAGATTSGATTTNTTSMQSAHVAAGTGTTERHVRVASGGLRALPGASVAAKTADEPDRNRRLGRAAHHADRDACPVCVPSQFRRRSMTTNVDLLPSSRLTCGFVHSQRPPAPAVRSRNALSRRRPRVRVPSGSPSPSPRTVWSGAFVPCDPGHTVAGKVDASTFVEPV